MIPTTQKTWLWGALITCELWTWHLFEPDIDNLAAGEKSIPYLTIWGKLEETDMVLSWCGSPIRRVKQWKRFDWSKMPTSYKYKKFQLMKKCQRENDREHGSWVWGQMLLHTLRQTDFQFKTCLGHKDSPHNLVRPCLTAEHEGGLGV